jgi:multidrug efflux pump subunit AcrA (membrane-fusion protein)
MSPNNQNENDNSETPESDAIPQVSRVMKVGFFTFLFIVALLAGIFGGPMIKTFVADMFSPEEATQSAANTSTETDEESTWYIGPMHPWIIQPEPGDCPICGMDLVPVDPDRFAGEIIIDPVVLQNIGVRIKPVVDGSTQMNIRTVGNISYDETRVKDVNLKISGWAEKVYVDSEGLYVRKGAPLLEIYSPELYATQEEYLLLSRSSGVPGNVELLQAVKTRLSLFDIGEDQIAEIERNGVPTRTMTIKAPYSGYVINKHVNEGMQLMPGMLVYRIADLSKVWVQASLYEYQLPHIKIGQSAKITLPYLPGETFEGKITYIYPYLNENSREVQVRLELNNSRKLFKPGMFADIELSSGADIVGVLVPSEAIIRTGERNLAFVSLGEGKFEPREVSLGREAGDGMYEVLNGLDVGEQVVVSGQFLLDSESRVRESLAKMMKGDLASEQFASAEVADAGQLVSLPPEVQTQLIVVLENYFEIQRLLYNDSLAGVNKSAKTIVEAIKLAAAIELPDDLHFWHNNTELATVQKHAALLASVTDINRARIEFGSIGLEMSNFIKLTGLPDSFQQEIVGVKCGMFSEAPEGGIWLQASGTIQNPFYGADSPMNDCSSEKWGFGTSETKIEVSEKAVEVATKPKATAEPKKQATALNSEALKVALEVMIEDYLELHSALYNGHFDHAKMVASRLAIALEAQAATWSKISSATTFQLKAAELASSGDIEIARAAFGHIGISLEEIVISTGLQKSLAENLVVKHCGMYPDAPEGGIWIQKSGDTVNPFFGKGSPMEACAPKEWSLGEAKN